MTKFVISFTFASAIFLSAWQPTQAQQVVEPSAKQVSVNGTIIRYWEQGRGVSVVFVHGAISDHRYWEPQREAVAKRYRFIAIDRRYFGTAPWPDDRSQNSQATHVADLAAFIRELRIGPVFLVGTSGGAVLSLLTAVQHPELVRGLFVNEPGLRSIVTDPAEQKLVREFDTDARRMAARAAAKAGNMTEAARIFADFANGQPGTFDAAPPERKAAYVDNARTLALENTPLVPITCGQLGQLKVPVTITKGQLTKPGSKLLAEAAHRCIPRSQLITIPAARHGAPWQNTSAFNEALLMFLSAERSGAHRSTEEMQVKKLEVNGVELAYVEEGKGETVVFVHGGGVGDWASWEKLRPFISKKYRYVSLSRRYHHPNPWMDDGRNYTMEQHVEDVAAFIRALKVGKVHLVGNSFGGGIVGRVALKHPELLRSLSFGERLISPVSAEGKAAVAAAQKENEKGRQALKAGDLRQAAILQYDSAVGEQGAFEKLPTERQKQLLYNAKTLSLEQRSREQRAELTCEQLGTLNVPILLIRGERTGDAQRYGFEATISCLPKTAETAIIPGAPHSWHTPNPGDSAKAILAFIAKH